MARAPDPAPTAALEVFRALRHSVRYQAFDFGHQRRARAARGWRFRSRASDVGRSPCRAVLRFLARWGGAGDPAAASGAAGSPRAVEGLLWRASDTSWAFAMPTPLRWGGRHRRDSRIGHHAARGRGANGLSLWRAAGEQGELPCRPMAAFLTQWWDRADVVRGLIFREIKLCSFLP
jgi:hypothetical protein